MQQHTRQYPDGRMPATGEALLQLVDAAIEHGFALAHRTPPGGKEQLAPGRFELIEVCEVQSE